MNERRNDGSNGAPAAGRSLAARVDGVLLPDDDGRALWQRFSAHMEANKGDLAGFAASEGFASIQPGLENGRPVLLASKSAPQGAYVNVATGQTGGPDPDSSKRATNSGSPAPRGGASNGGRSSKNRRRR